ncbi:hypothetical protein ACIQAA_32155 [Neobacillus sp. NPDC093182]
MVKERVNITVDPKVLDEFVGLPGRRELSFRPGYKSKWKNLSRKKR